MSRFTRLALALVALTASSRAQDPRRDEVPVDPDALLAEDVRESLAGLDPSRGGWAGEVLLERVAEPLAQLRAALEGASDPWIAAGGIAREDMGTGRFVELGDAVRHGPFAIAELVTDLRGAVRAPGAAALAEDLSALRDLVGEAGRRVKIKVVATEPEAADEAEDGATDDAAGGGATRLRIELFGGDAQVVAHARAEWIWTGADDAPRLAAFRVEDAERVGGFGRPLFAEVTEAVLGGEVFDAQLRPGLEHWRARLDTTLGVGFLGHQGVAVGDVDGNGLEDLYLCQPGGLPNRLFLHREDGTTREASAEAGVDVLDPCSSALLVDLDGDAALDLVVAAGEELALFRGDGLGRFTPVVKLPAPTTTSLAAADADGDGHVDLFACAYQSPYDGRSTPLPYHDAENGAANVLYLNRGEFAFEDGSEAAGFRAAPPRFSFAAAWEDFDRDGDQDLYVANDFGRNELWRNDGDGRFVDVAALLGVEDLSAGMGVSWADVDGDGWPDLHVANMYSSAGNRVAYGRTFRPEADEDERESYRRHARGDSLFLNAEGRAFIDVSDQARIGMGRWAWGALFVELDNDGRPDLVVPNGFVTSERNDDL